MVWVALVCLIIAGCISLVTGMIVNTRNGQLLGTVENSRQGRPFFAYRGIPYAAPPVGDLRFEVSSTSVSENVALICCV